MRGLPLVAAFVALSACSLSGLKPEDAAPRDCETRTAYYHDADGDGFGDELQVAFACAAEAGWVEAAGDCDDADPARASDCSTDTGDTGDTDETGRETGGDTAGDSGDTAGDTGGDTGDTGGDTGAPPSRPAARASSLEAARGARRC